MGIFLSWASRLGGELAFHPVAEIGGLMTVKKTNNPNPSPIGNKFGLYWFGADDGTRTRTAVGH